MTLMDMESVNAMFLSVCKDITHLARISFYSLDTTCAKQNKDKNLQEKWF